MDGSHLRGHAAGCPRSYYKDPGPQIGPTQQPFYTPRSLFSHLPSRWSGWAVDRGGCSPEAFRSRM